MSDRFSESAARILDNLGGRRSFHRLASTRNALLGSETYGVVDGSEVSARSRLIWATRKKDGGVRERYEMIAAERAPFEPGGLSDSWEVQLDGAWVPLQNVTLSDDHTTWEAELCRPAEATS